MKYLILLSSLLSFNLFAQSDFDQQAFQMSGFEITGNNSKALELNHHTGLKIVISKDKFRTEKEAAQFCSNRNLKLDTEMRALLLAMSGLTNISEFMKSAILFDYGFSSGLISWSGKNTERVQLMIDGQSTSVLELSVAELHEAISRGNIGITPRVTLPAICTE